MVVSMGASQLPFRFGRKRWMRCRTAGWSEGEVNTMEIDEKTKKEKEI